MSTRDLDFLFGQFVPRCTHNIAKRFEGYWVLQYSAGGSVQLAVDEKRYTMEGRWFWSSYPGPMISFKPSPLAGSGAGGAAGQAPTTWVHRYLAFKGTAVKRWEAEGIFPIEPMPAPPAPPQEVHSGEDYWAHQFDLLLELSRREDFLGRRRAALQIERLLCELADARSSAVASPDWLVAAKARLEALGTDDVDYTALATEFGFSPRTFRREFTRRTGLPPHRYLLASRISHARELLAHTDLPIKQITRELGYRDVFYFTRQFKRVVGVPPGMYRKSREG